MSIGNCLGKFGAALALAAGAMSANAAIDLFTSQDVFAAAVAPTFVDTFDDIFGSVPSPTTRGTGLYAYTASSANGLYGAGEGSDGWLSTNFSGDSVVFNGFSTSLNAVGGFFFGSDIAGSFAAGNAITVTAVDSLGDSMSSTITGATTSSFVGFKSNGYIVSVTATVADTDAFVTVNDLSLAAVPEPASVALVSLGLLLVVGASARRRRGEGPAS